MTTTSRSHFHWTGVVVIAAFAATVHADPPVMRDAATHQQLALTLRQADQADPMKNMPVAEGSDPSLVNRPADLIESSDIISFRGLATLVPKRAILQIPGGMGERMKLQPGARIVSWADFFVANRGWINVVEVSRVQAEGKEPIAEETRKFMSTCRNLIVATYMGGPISVLPPAPAPAPETATR